MNAIVCADARWGIGKNNALLVDIPADKHRFREYTTGKVIIGGRKTMEAFPGGRSLPDRKNIVLSRGKDYSLPGADVAHSTDEALARAKEYADSDVWIIGGEKIYRQFLPYCDKVYVTRVDFTYGADAFFPDLDREKDWEITYDSGGNMHQGVIYHFLTYERVG